MKKFFLLVLPLISASVFAQTTQEKLDAYMTASAKAGLFTGSVLVVDKGDIVLNKGYGYKDADAKAFNDQNTIYQLGSVTKQFTAAIILKLAEQGKLKLDDRLSKYFPEFPNADKITIENLLSHTSGIFNYTNNPEFMRNEVEKPINQQKLFEMVKDKPLDFEPGSKYSYSNTGYMMLGYIIEKVTGKKYEQVVRENILNPLGMTNSGFDFKGLKNPNKAVGYSTMLDGKGDKSMMVDSTVSFSAGAMYSTLGDMHRWNKSLQTEQILKKESIKNAFTPRLSNYGLGWMSDTLAGKRAIVHGGGIHGFLSYNVIFPEENSSITLLSNVTAVNDNQVAKDLIAILNNLPYELPKEKTEVKVDEKILKQYVGEYELAPSFFIKVWMENGQLKAQATGQPSFDLFPKNEREFFLKVVDAQVEFIKNEKGQVEKLILHQNGQHIPGVKKK